MDGAALDRALHNIERNAHVQVQLLDDLLDMARVITGKLRIDSHAVEVRNGCTR